MLSKQNDRHSLEGAKSAIYDAKFYCAQLEAVLKYLKSPAAPVIHNDGEILKYIGYLMVHIQNDVEIALNKMNTAGIDDELPF